MKQAIKYLFGEKEDLSIILLVVVLYYVQHLIALRLGFNYEEGRDGNAYLMAMQGLMPYRDFEWLYGPLTFFIYPFIMKLFGVNLLVLRASYIVFCSFVIPLTYFLARRIMPPLWAGIAAFLAIIFFDVPYYTFNHIFSVLGALVCLLMICKFIERNRSIIYIIWAGIFNSIALLNKPLSLGLALVLAACVYFLFFERQILLINRIKYCFIFICAASLPVAGYMLYFYSQTGLKNIDVLYPMFAGYTTVSAVLLPKVNTGAIFSAMRYCWGNILYITRISSYPQVKKAFVNILDILIFVLPFAVSVCILSMRWLLRFADSASKIKDKICADSRYLYLFILFSLFISIETFIVVNIYMRAYMIQVPFILTVYLLWIIVSYSNKRIIAATFMALFLLSIGSLHFLRYPYSMLKKFTVPLDIQRARGILVTANEKRAYEGLSSYLLLHLPKEDKIAVMGYYPHISFLTQRKNIFQDQEYLFIGLETLLGNPGAQAKGVPILTERITSKIRNENPGLVIIVLNYDKSLTYPNAMAMAVKDCIKNKYYLDRIFGPLDIFGLGDEMYWVNVYKLKH